MITGANSGIGRASAVYLAQQGIDVYGSMRNLDKAEKLQAMAADAGVSIELVELDVVSDESVTAGIGHVLDTAGRLDVLVNNAGIGGNGVTEFVSIDAYRELMDVNVYGAIRCIQAVLPHMRERGSGHIVNITSIAGVIAAIGQAPYALSKRAAEAMSESLAQEVAPFGIRVSVIEPGITKSAIFAKNVDAPGIDVYPDPLRWMFQFYANGIPNATPAEEVGRVIHHAITTNDPKLRYPVGVDAHAIVDGFARMTDEQWVALGAAASDDEYYSLFEQHFGLDIGPTDPT